jgi:hypothetical protein
VTDGIKRVALTAPAGYVIQVAEDQVDQFLANGWSKVRGGSRRADTGSIPTQAPSNALPGAEK